MESRKQNVLAEPGEPAQRKRIGSDLVAVTGSSSDSPWSRPTDKRCVFIKNRPATSSHHKQGCLSAANAPVSVLALAHASARFAVLPPLSSITADASGPKSGERSQWPA